MRIYLHRESTHDPDSIETEPTAVIRDAVGIIENGIVLLEDADTPLDLAQTFEESRVPDKAHLFHGQRHRIVAAVRFNSETITREFSTSTRVDRVFRWAVGNDGFDLSKPDAADHTLQLPDGTVPPGDAHLGSLDDTTPGRVDFDLAPKHRFEG
jgi:hypothetical protein